MNVEFVATAGELLNNIFDRFSNICILIQNKNTDDIGAKISFLAEDLETLTEAINIINEETAAFDLQELNEKLEAVLQYFERQDYMAMSDLIQYDLQPLLEQWRESLRYVH